MPFAAADRILAFTEAQQRKREPWENQIIDHPTRADQRLTPATSSPPTLKLSTQFYMRGLEKSSESTGIE